MVTYTIVTFILLIFSIPSVLFLLDYRRLVRHGTQTSGEVVDYEIRIFMFDRAIRVPKISFHTNTGKTVTMRPAHTYFAGLHWYPLNSFVKTYYQNDKPERFVIRNAAEVIANCLIVLFAIGAIMGLII
jgi:hypothetical protein